MKATPDRARRSPSPSASGLTRRRSHWQTLSRTCTACSFSNGRARRQKASAMLDRRPAGRAQVTNGAIRRGVLTRHAHCGLLTGRRAQTVWVDVGAQLSIMRILEHYRSHAGGDCKHAWLRGLRPACQGCLNCSGGLSKPTTRQREVSVINVQACFVRYFLRLIGLNGEAAAGPARGSAQLGRYPRLPYGKAGFLTNELAHTGRAV